MSKSSWGMDYHKVLKRMEDLVKEIQHIRNSITGVLWTPGPVDRELAKKAGAGYYGRNCSLVNPEYGSFIFIGYILTDLE